MDMEKYIDFNNISLNGNKYKKEDILELLKSKKAGRILITGKNGSGKSSLLSYVHHIQDHTFYLPTNPDLDIQTHKDIFSLSTGEKMQEYLNYLNHNDHPILLLDEWNANLDSETQEKYSAIIDDIARRSLVLEVSHIN